MRRVTKPLKPREDRYIFTEGVNYLKTGKASIWGSGDKDTLKILKELKIRGRWLNLAAGDGRYNLDLLKKADSVIASDIDESALSKLWHNTPERYKPKLETREFDITKKLPFKDSSFDGVFCTGALHLFPIKVFKSISYEIFRVLKPRGRVIIDFATDIKRISSEGRLIKFGDELGYSLKEAKTLLKEVFSNYKSRMYESKVSEEIKKGNPSYKFSCNFILLVADK